MAGLIESLAGGLNPYVSKALALRERQGLIEQDRLRAERGLPPRPEPTFSDRAHRFVSKLPVVGAFVPEPNVGAPFDPRAQMQAAEPTNPFIPGTQIPSDEHGGFGQGLGVLRRDQPAGGGAGAQREFSPMEQRIAMAKTPSDFEAILLDNKLFPAEQAAQMAGAEQFGANQRAALAAGTSLSNAQTRAGASLEGSAMRADATVTAAQIRSSDGGLTVLPPGATLVNKKGEVIVKGQGTAASLKPIIVKPTETVFNQKGEFIASGDINRVRPVKAEPGSTLFNPATKEVVGQGIPLQDKAVTVGPDETAFNIQTGGQIGSGVSSSQKIVEQGIQTRRTAFATGKAATPEISDLYTPKSIQEWAASGLASPEAIPDTSLLRPRPLSVKAEAALAKASQSVWKNERELAREFIRTVQLSGYAKTGDRFRTFLGSVGVRSYSAIPTELRQQVERFFPNGIPDASAARDLAMIFGFMKVLDPESVVRETEQEVAARARGLGIEVHFRKVLSGERLTDVQRADFISTASSIFERRLDPYLTLVNDYRQLAKMNGLNPDNVAIDILSDLTAMSSRSGSGRSEAGPAEFNRAMGMLQQNSQGAQPTQKAVVDSLVGMGFESIDDATMDMIQGLPEN